MVAAIHRRITPQIKRLQPARAIGKSNTDEIAHLPVQIMANLLLCLQKLRSSTHTSPLKAIKRSITARLKQRIIPRKRDRTIKSLHLSLMLSKMPSHHTRKLKETVIRKSEFTFY